MAAVIFAATFFLPVSVGAMEPHIGIGSFLDDLSSQDREIGSPSPIIGRVSSNDPGGTDEDCGVYLREDGLEHVLLDVTGPGVLRSFWVEEPQGYLRFYWDGAETPQFETLWSELAEGKHPPLEYPFVYRLGCSMEMVYPLTFQSGLKITLTGQSRTEHTLDYQLFRSDVMMESWWPGMANPDPSKVLTSTFEQNLKAPHLIQWGKQAWESDEELLYNGGRNITFVPEANTFVRGVEFLQSGKEPLPDGCLFQLETKDGNISVPWNALTGLWSGTDDQESIYTGRHGRRSWFRYPFLMEKGDKLIFTWDDNTDGELFGRVAVRYDSVTPEGSDWRPRLEVYTKEFSGVQHTNLDISGAGLVVQTSFQFNTLNQPAVRELDLELVPDGMRDLAWKTTSLAGLLRTSRRGVLEPFASGYTGLSVVDDQTISGYSSFPNPGVLYYDYLSLRMDVPSCTSGTLVMVSLQQPELNELPVVPIVASSQSLIGRRSSASSTGNTEIYNDLEHDHFLYEYHLPPLSGIVTPTQVEVSPDQNEFSGTFSLSQGLKELPHLRVSLDLPFGWKGELSCGDETKEVFDIGWPWFDYYPCKTGDLDYQWKVFPPSDIPGGKYLVQLRAEAQLPDGGRQVLRRPVSVQVAPRREPELELIPGLTDDGLTSVTLPEKFKTEPGDLIYALAKYEGTDVCGVSTATLTYEMGLNENTRDYADPPEVFLPPDGKVYTEIVCDGQPHWIRFPAGKFQSWFKNWGELAFSLEEFGPLSVDQVRLYRPALPPEVEGWSRRIPYVESPAKAFHLPRYRLLLQKKQLLQSMEVVVGTNKEQIDPVFRPANYLENVQAGNLIWRFADPPRRYPDLKPSHSFEFLATHTGSRIKVQHPKLAGTQFIGIEFGYGPDCGRVGVRDCEGRLVITQDLFLPQKASVPQWTWITLPYPNRDGWIYLESLGEAPCSLGQKIPLQKVMVVGNIEDEF